MRFSDWEIPELNSDAAADTCHAVSCCQLSLPSTFKHSPAKLPTSLLSYPSLFLTTRLPFGIPICYLLMLYIFFLINPSPFWATHRPSKLPITVKHNSKCKTWALYSFSLSIYALFQTVSVDLLFVSV
jgi:hypothetical protein